MKTLKKIAAVAAIVLGLGVVTSCGNVPTEEIDAKFVAQDDFEWAVGTWDGTITVDGEHAAEDAFEDEDTLTFKNAAEAKYFFAEMVETAEMIKEYGEGTMTCLVSKNRKVFAIVVEDDDGCSVTMTFTKRK